MIEGTAIAMRLVGARHAVIGIKEKYTDVIDLVVEIAPHGRRGPAPPATSSFWSTMCWAGRSRHVDPLAVCGEC